VSWSNHELVGRNLIAPQIDMRHGVLYRHQRALWSRDGQLPFCFAKKVTQKGDPDIRPDPTVLATRGIRTNRPMAR